MADDCENCGINLPYVGQGSRCDSCLAEDRLDEIVSLKTKLLALQTKHNEAMSHIATLEVEVNRLVRAQT